MKLHPSFKALLLFLTLEVSCQNLSPDLPHELHNNPILAQESTYREHADIFEQINIEPSVNHGALQVFPIYGPSTLENKSYLTLNRAMEQELVVVNETGNVGELSITNKSDRNIYIHSGDLVKGGRQDRTMAYDAIIPPNANGIPLKSFCVEQARWAPRGNENVHHFSSSNKMLSSKTLRYAAKYQNNQQAVWSNVAKEQLKLSENISKNANKQINVQDNVSGSSLQLTLEHESLKKIKKDMEVIFSGFTTKFTDAVGYAYAINGVVFGVELFNNKKLFRELWSKLSQSFMDEAIAEFDSLIYDKASVQDVLKFMKKPHHNSDDVGNKINKKEINTNTQLINTESAKNVLFTTVDKEAKNWLHKSYMEKSVSEPVMKKLNYLPESPIIQVR